LSARANSSTRAKATKHLQGLSSKGVNLGAGYDKARSGKTKKTTGNLRVVDKKSEMLHEGSTVPVIFSNKMTEAQRREAWERIVLRGEEGVLFDGKELKKEPPKMEDENVFRNKKFQIWM